MGPAEVAIGANAPKSVHIHIVHFWVLICVCFDDLRFRWWQQSWTFSSWPAIFGSRDNRINRPNCEFVRVLNHFSFLALLDLVKTISRHPTIESPDHFHCHFAGLFRLSWPRQEVKQKKCSIEATVGEQEGERRMYTLQKETDIGKACKMFDRIERVAANMVGNNEDTAFDGRLCEKSRLTFELAANRNFWRNFMKSPLERATLVITCGAMRPRLEVKNRQTCSRCDRWPSSIGRLGTHFHIEHQSNKPFRCFRLIGLFPARRRIRNLSKLSSFDSDGEHVLCTVKCTFVLPNFLCLDSKKVKFHSHFISFFFFFLSENQLVYYHKLRCLPLFNQNGRRRFRIFRQIIHEKETRVKQRFLERSWWKQKMIEMNFLFNYLQLQPPATKTNYSE